MMGTFGLSGYFRHAAIALLLAAFFLVCRSGLADADSGPQARPNFTQDQITLRGKDGATRTLKVELARTEEEVSYGLMYLSDLPGTDGMLFRMPYLGRFSFWMKNTIMPLDIVFLNEKGEVVNMFTHTVPLSTEHLFSSGPALMVLEVKAGMAEKWGIGPGATITPPQGFLP